MFLAFFLVKKKKMSFVAEMELSELPMDSSKLNKVVFCLHGLFKMLHCEAVQ